MRFPQCTDLMKIKSFRAEFKTPVQREFVLARAVLFQGLSICRLSLRHPPIVSSQYLTRQSTFTRVSTEIDNASFELLNLDSV
ncbi:hypothetical protein CEXT_470071 [Caerostris extrusa]|uniref:Uncharacterized protein n=1 Tax=Caerostris extrusa TaxID=172846 RepID=A0AAV4YA57_CAEEX|nr:hypothetical protein CEXT_470071 [Caerostris extrusa]